MVWYGFVHKWGKAIIKWLRKGLVFREKSAMPVLHKNKF